MLRFYTSVIPLISQSKEIGEKQFSVFGSGGGQNTPLMHVPLYPSMCDSVSEILGDSESGPGFNSMSQHFNSIRVITIKRSKHDKNVSL